MGRENYIDTNAFHLDVAIRSDVKILSGNILKLTHENTSR